MAAAQAHQRASTYCFDKPDAKAPNIDALFFPIVSFELILLSVEQSLRLLLLLNFGAVLDRVDHNLAVLYKNLRRKSGKSEDLRHKIVSMMNALGENEGIDAFSEEELVKCLKKHDSSYSNFRYFQMDRKGKVSTELELLPREVQIMHSLALALIMINAEEMSNRDINIIHTMSAVPRSKMTAELKAVVDRLSW